MATYDCFVRSDLADRFEQEVREAVAEGGYDWSISSRSTYSPGVTSFRISDPDGYRSAFRGVMVNALEVDVKDDAGQFFIGVDPSQVESKNYLAKKESKSAQSARRMIEQVVNGTDPQTVIDESVDAVIRVEGVDSDGVRHEPVRGNHGWECSCGELAGTCPKCGCDQIVCDDDRCPECNFNLRDDDLDESKIRHEDGYTRKNSKKYFTFLDKIWKANGGRESTEELAELLVKEFNLDYSTAYAIAFDYGNDEGEGTFSGLPLEFEARI